MKITLTSKGDFKKTKKFFSSLRRREYLRELDRFGAMEVRVIFMLAHRHRYEAKAESPGGL
jgi:hypothetical protein